MLRRFRSVRGPLRALRLALPALGLLLLCLSAALVWAQIRPTLGWLKAEGRVVSVRVDRERVEGEASFVPRLRYIYEVDGARHEGGRIAFGPEPSFGEHAAAAKFLDRYPVGAAIAVRYDPSDPEQAALRAGPRWIAPAALAAVGLAFLGLGAMSAGAAAQSRRVRARRTMEERHLT